LFKTSYRPCRLQHFECKKDHHWKELQHWPAQPSNELKKAGNNSNAYSVKELGANMPQAVSEKMASAMNGPRFAPMSIKFPQGRGYVTSARKLGQIRGILPTKSLKGQLFGKAGLARKVPPARTFARGRAI
jgi:hypothetical protein